MNFVLKVNYNQGAFVNEYSVNPKDGLNFFSRWNLGNNFYVAFTIIKNL